MTFSVRRLFIVTILASLQYYAFSQAADSARSLYLSGEALAIKNPNKAFQFLERAMNLAQQNKEWSIYLLSVNKLASLDLDDREEKIFEWLKEAVQVLKDSKEDSTLAQLHFSTGEYYNKLTNEIDPPISHYQKAKQIWTRLKGEWSEEVSNCYHGLVNIYKYYKFDFYEAEKCYEKALLIRERINFQNLDVLYQNYYSLAATNRSQHDFEKALSYGTKALDLAKKFPRRTEMSSGMIANIYRDMGESLLAKKYYLNALVLNKRTNDLEYLDNRAWYYNCLGETFKNDSSFAEAVAYFKMAYNLYEIPEVKDQNLFLNLLMNMIETYSLMGDEKNFIKKTRELSSLLDSLDMLHSKEAWQLWLLNGDHQQRKSNYDSALYYFQKSLIASVPSFISENFSDNPTEDKIGFRYVINESLVKKASVLKIKFLRTGDVTDLNQSLGCLRLAEKLLSKQRNTLDTEDAKWKFLDSNYDLYEDILSSLYHGEGELSLDTLNLLAFQYFEQSKSRSLADALAQAEQTRKISGEDSLLQVLADLKRQLFSAQDAINRESDKFPESQKVIALREDVVNVDKNIQAVKFALEEKYPGYFNVKYGYQPMALADVQKMLKTKKKVLLEYFWGNESVYGIGVSDQRVLFKRIGSPDSIRVVVNELLSHLTNERSSLGVELFKSFTKNAGELYRILVKPFGLLLSGEKRIQIIPDGSIGQIPFEILVEEPPQDMTVNYRSLKYLIKSFTMGYAYSSAMFLRKLGKENVATPSLLAFGFTGDKRSGDGTMDLGEIAGAEDELKALSEHFKTGKFLIGYEATESNFKIMAPAFDIIHLAIHGKGDVQKNFAASLYFQSQRDSIDDGELHAYELYGLKLKALMAVLSSCESGLGKGYRGEGMISMANAFTYSGCENILMSLWKVNDQTSTTLMDNFYKYLLEGESIDEALRQAKLNYLELSDELTAHPKIWAPLIAYGNLDEVFKTDRSVIIAIGGLSILLISILSFEIYRRHHSI